MDMKKFMNKRFATGNVLCGFLVVVMSMLSFVACSENEGEALIDNNVSSLSLAVNIDGWGDTGSTRASYSAISEGSSGNKVFGLSFTSGDAIGLFACDKDGKVVIANHKWSYNGSAWATESPIEYVTGMGGYTFFAYYPWKSSLSGAPALNSTPDISSAEAFFGSAISAWTPAADQSTIAAFTGSDLMMAKGTTSTPYFHEVQVAFTMAHQMGLAVTQPDLTFYDINDPSYTWTVTQSFTGNIPYQIGSNYYYLVKPGVETTIGAKSTTLAARQVEQLFFTNMEPGRVEYDGEKKMICLDNIKLGSSPTYSYSVSSNLGTTWGNWKSGIPSWLTFDNTITGNYITKIGTTATNSTSTTTSLGTGNARNVPGDAILKSASPVSNVDLSMVDNAGSARISRTTANCYLVHAPGTYKIPLVYGNAIKNGDETSTTAFYTTQTKNTLQRLVNHADEGITSPWIKTQLGSCPDGAQLVWEDVQGMISSVGIDTSENGFLTFTVDANNIAEGNAVIAATLDGTIVWSWHVWVTTQTLTNLTSINTGSHTYQVAPVNVGQVTGTFSIGATIYAGDLGKIRVTANGITVEFPVTAKDYMKGGATRYNPCTYYQGGRKDALYPLTGGYNVDGTLINSYSGSTLVTSTGSTPGATIQHPDYLFTNNNRGGPYGTNSTYVGKYNYWDMNQTSTGNIATATVKTVYDPCPPGFCIPTSNLFYFIGNGDRRNDSNWTSGQGKTWRAATYSANTTGNDLFFSVTGYRSDTGSLNSDVPSEGYCWSATPASASHVMFINLEYDYSKWRFYDRYAEYSLPVRPVAEE